MLFRLLFSPLFKGLALVSVWFVLVQSVHAQSTFDFTGPAVLVSGSDLQQGAVYRYSSVATDLDALVEVVALNSATLVQLDDAAGIARALQAEIDGDAEGSFVEFKITFVDSGTSDAALISGVFSTLDVDSVSEFDTFFNVSDYTLETNTDVAVAVLAPKTLQITGGGPGYDPLSEANTAVVVSVGFNELAGFSYRLGVNGNSTRQTSLLFEPVTFTDADFNNINDAPVGVPDTNTTVENAALVVPAISGLLSNDTDIDVGIDTDILVVDSITVGVDTYTVNSSVSLVEGELTVDSDGGYQFIPAANFSGPVPLVSYQLSDGNGGTDSTTLSLTVTSVNVAPVANNDSATLTSNQPLTIAVLENDTDDSGLDANSLVWTADLTSYPADSMLSSDLKVLTIPGEGVWTIFGGATSFAPVENSSGQVSPVQYEVSDTNGESATAFIELIDGLATVAPEVTIDEDSNDDGFISAAEINGVIDVSADLPAQAVLGDRVSFSSQEETIEVLVEDSNLESGQISVAFVPLSDGELLQVRVSLIDAAGNQSPVSRDQALVDISAPEAPEVIISTDLDNSGFISLQENSPVTTIEVRLPPDASVNDKLTVTTGSTATEVVLTPVDLANGSVTLSVDTQSDGAALSVVAHITDEAGNRSVSGSDSAMIDLSSPLAPTVNALLSANPTPAISGTVPTDNNYLLSVQVNDVVYASGDGQLVNIGNGIWTLVIPPADALEDGIYDVVAVVSDMAGNSTSDITSNELTIDLIQPEIAADNVGPSSDRAPVIKGSSDQADGRAVIVLTDSGTRVCSAEILNGQWRCASQILLSVGTNTLRASVLDLAGNLAVEEFAAVVVASPDSDEDGIADDQEGTDDNDGDGIANYLDLDSDNDTITDDLETQIDRDGDGIRNYLDPDADNDGIADIDERSRGVIVNQDDAQIADTAELGVNGIADAYETEPDSGIAIPVVDTDGDQIPDYLDHDSDGDGISDVVENGHADNDGNAMRDDGLVVAVLDFDRDGIFNFRDLDSDQDGIPDVLELPATDSNGDGKTDELIDADNSGLSDSITSQSTAGLAQDLDGDGAANFLDLDSDGDRRLDIIEAGGSDVDNNGIHDSFVDINGNAIDDSVDVLLTMGIDADGDLIDDRFDSDFTDSLDSDNDGIIDTHDADANGNGLADQLDDVVIQLPDLNGDGQIDAYEPVTPETAAVLHTGTGTLGGGCAMSSGVNSSAGTPRIDLLLIWLLLGALAGVHRKRFKVVHSLRR